MSSKPKELESFISCLLNYPNGNILCLVHVNSIKEYIIFDTTLKKKKDMQNSTIFALLCESKTVPKWEVKTKYMGRFATANNTKPKICVKKSVSVTVQSIHKKDENIQIAYYFQEQTHALLVGWKQPKS